jgi:murein tripeptide amidase MpaA
MSYFNVDEVESAILGLSNQYSTLCELIELPNRSVEGRTSHALRIGRKDKPNRSPGILFTGCVHAREWGGAEILIHFAADLLEAYTAQSGVTYLNKSFTAADVQFIVETMDVFAFPCVNPDGRNYSQTVDPVNNGGGWRKNRDAVDSGGQANKIGIDVNRNYDFLWDFRTHFDPSITNSFSLASDDPSSDVYHGHSPASEAETRNVVWLLDQYPVIEWFMDIHSFSGDILYPWGDGPDQSNDNSMNFHNPAYDHKRGIDNASIYGPYIPSEDLARFQSVGQRVRDAIAAVRGQSYELKQSFYLHVGNNPANNVTYPTSGCGDDYAYSRNFADPTRPKVRSFTLEFGLPAIFNPDWAEMQNIVLDVDSGLMAFCLATFLRVPTHIPLSMAQILFGIIQDGGGIEFVPGRGIIRVPPWDPWVRDILSALAICEIGASMTDAKAIDIRKAALGVIQNVVTKEQQRG